MSRSAEPRRSSYSASVVIVSSQMHVYLSQSDRGEFVMGSEIEPWTTYQTRNTLNFLQDLTRHTLELFPQL